MAANNDRIACHDTDIRRYLLGIYSNEVAKQRVFSHFLTAMDYNDFKSAGEKLSKGIDVILNIDVYEKLKPYQSNGCQVLVISASILEWVLPWCQKEGVDCFKE